MAPKMVVVGNIFVSGTTNHAEKLQLIILMIFLNGVCQFCGGERAGYGERSPERHSPCNYSTLS
jgi:hypothetical protein